MTTRPVGTNERLLHRLVSWRKEGARKTELSKLAPDICAQIEAELARRGVTIPPLTPKGTTHDD